MLFKTTISLLKYHTSTHSPEPRDCFKKCVSGLLALVEFGAKPCLLTRLIRIYVEGTRS